jgi:hypothetical protein
MSKQNLRNLFKTNALKRLSDDSFEVTLNCEKVRVQ